MAITMASNDDEETAQEQFEIDNPCEDDRCRAPKWPVWHCVDCSSDYCSECWPLQGPHKPGKLGRDGVPHEKTDPQVVARLQDILQPTEAPDAIRDAHSRDEASKWFGVTKDLTGRPKFEDYGRYASLMASITPAQHRGNRYPQLVSFIGVTNAGKSTIIKMLINHQNAAPGKPNPAASFPSPIVGSVIHDALPTSGDVHLYADPATHAHTLPLLYADCEGFEGGERLPLGARARRRAGSDPQVKEGSASANVHARIIGWADTEETRQREFAVRELYPRLLYTFSDVVIFVLRNPKTFQSAVLTKLVEWGVSALEKSINQPALPHAIVVLNATDPGVDDREWDTNYATQSLLSSVKGSLDHVEGVPRLRELAEHWRQLGKHIYTVEDLILRYYASFQVIRIPTKPRYMVINEQVGKLHAMIKDATEKSFRTKRSARMLTNSDELNVYLQSGFDHFTSHLDIPFNFVQISLKSNPIPYDFGGHILQLATTVAAQHPKQGGRASWLFEKLSVMLASCVLLDCARFRKGRMEDLFSNYEQFFDWALAEFCELHWPCSYVHETGRRCLLVKARHNVKGHQDDTGIIAAGGYQASFTVESYGPVWKEQLRSAITSLQRDFNYELEQANHGNDLVSDGKIALDLHEEYIAVFFATVGHADNIYSHATCFSCLMEVPEHPLPCGHVLCTQCVKAFGKPYGRSGVSLTSCPLHTATTQWSKSLQINFKPEGAGVRVLSLDGGGVRGIVQLEVLREIEQALGNFVPIQDFFDLIVGTGTGGIIATALGVQQKPTHLVLDMFTAICDLAYTPKVRGFPLLKYASALSGASRYKTKPLYRALRTAFGEDYLFGGISNSETPQRLKVAVTTTSATGHDNVLLANYRRTEDNLPFYHFERPHDPAVEMKIWEANAATTATPTCFKPFVNPSTHRTYLDGGVRCVNPVAIADRERRLLWPDVADREPDIFLSLGTGQNRLSVLNSLGQAGTPNGKDKEKSRGLSRLWQALSNRGDDVLEAEAQWSDFKSKLPQDQSDSGGRRYIRFNPDLEYEPPAVEDKNDLRSLQATVRKRLWLPHRQAALQHVAHRLVASVFYFEIKEKETLDAKVRGCTGKRPC